MDELEQRLRSALTELADEVPASKNAWAEHERRLARRAKRARLRPALMAVAAAAAVALIAVPVLLLNSRGNDKELDVATRPPDPSTSDSPRVTSLPKAASQPTYQPGPGESVLMQPVPLMGEQDGRESRTIYGFAVTKNNQAMLCIGQGPLHSGPSYNQAEDVQQRNCMGIPQARPGKVVALKYNVPSANNGGAYLFVSTNETARILVRRTEGNLVVASKIGDTPAFSVFFTVLGSNKPIVAYTAKDSANQTLEDS
jgi:hypothetical protein